MRISFITGLVSRPGTALKNCIFTKNEDMHFLDATLETYIGNHSEEEPELLRQLSRETHLKVLQPRMITGHLQGRLLSTISKILRPQFILEIGTYTGYSALCLAEGLRNDGELHTIDINEELADIQQRYIDKSPYADRIKRHTGNAIDIVPQLNHSFDLVYIDAEKKEYLSYFEVVMPKIHPGSLLLSDNVLWSGKVLEPAAEGDKSTAVLQQYNRLLKEDPRLETVLLPIRDGLTISRVK
jgi:predicted O-methyltransferase YrrM